MSRSSSSSPRPEQLELNLYPPRPNIPDHESPLNSNGTETTSSELSTLEGSCLSSSENMEERRGTTTTTVEYCESNSDGVGSRQVITRSMMLVGCPRCLMYVMLSEEVDPKCPKCNSKVLLNLNH